jgi:hypothetical protein
MIDCRFLKPIKQKPKENNLPSTCANKGEKSGENRLKKWPKIPPQSTKKDVKGIVQKYKTSLSLDSTDTFRLILRCQS